MVRQRRNGDCGVAALATLLDWVPYEEVYFAIAKVDPVARGGNGLWLKDLIAAAAHLGYTLERRRSFEDDEDGL
ncbi:MAG TPA: hypothetical protein VEI97_09255, partial [bacterium]|nr:hypothetical protein [bacterium]